MWELVNSCVRLLLCVCGPGRQERRMDVMLGMQDKRESAKMSQNS